MELLEDCCNEDSSSDKSNTQLLSKIRHSISDAKLELIELLKKYKLPVNYSKYINKKTIPALIKRIAFDKKIINKDVNFVLIGKSGGFIKKISIRDLKSILYQIN